MPTPARYPKYDLRSAIEAARDMREKAADGRTASTDELALFLGYKSKNNGAYLNRVSAMRMYGLLDGRGEDLRLTDRAMQILDPDLPTTAEKARLDAFFDVPIFSQFFQKYGGSGNDLPTGDYLKNAMAGLGLSGEHVNIALARMMDSAEEAGLFKTAGARTKMVRPTFGATNVVPHVPKPTPAEEPKKDNLLVLSARQHKIIDGMLDELPPVKDGMSEEDIEDWLDDFGRNLRRVYGIGRRPRPKSSAEQTIHEAFAVTKEAPS